MTTVISGTRRTVKRHVRLFYIWRVLKPLYHIASRLLATKNLHLIKGLNYLGRQTIIPLDRYDFIRVATLELIADEINSNGIQGSVAELGVYKGGFAKDLNAVFADRKLFLFDTFSGFDENDKISESIQGFGTKDQDFSDTSVDAVLSLMKYPDNCVIRKGKFPETVTGLESEKFSFVSIDADLYEPILAGLVYFYKNLSPGGFIMIHDYNNINYQGSKKAVREFCETHGVAYVPIPDSGGTVIIKKV
jgi:O-methyltransferase